MSSRLVVNSIRHSGASVDGITLDSSGLDILAIKAQLL